MSSAATAPLHHCWVAQAHSELAPGQVSAFWPNSGALPRCPRQMLGLERRRDITLTARVGTYFGCPSGPTEPNHSSAGIQEILRVIRNTLSMGKDNQSLPKDAVG